MADIAPFRGLIFNSDKLKYSNVITPPYDVITPEEAREYKSRSPYNLARLILTQNSGGKNTKIYAEKKKLFLKWIKEGALVKENKPCIYIVEQTAPDFKRIFFIAQTDITEFKSGILPHEKIYKKPQIDRYRLLKSLSAYTGVPLVIYPDLHRVTNNLFDPVMRRPPSIQFVDPLEIIYSVWKIYDAKTIKKLTAFMKNKCAVIADGHHRISAAVKYARENPQARFMPAAFANYHNEKEKVLPTHRLLYNLKNFNIKKFEEKLTRKFFDLHIFEYSDFDEEIQLEKMKKMMKEGADRVIGMYHAASKRYYALKIKDIRKIIEWMNTTNAASGTSVKKFLDVSMLHYIIFDKILGIPPEEENSAHLDYIKGSCEDAIKVFAGNKKYKLIFFLNKIKLRDVYEIALHKDTVPQKTTYFYPKIDSGVVMKDF